VRDRTAEGTFTARPFDIDVNPLMVAGAGGERVDTRLIDRGPFGQAKLLSNSFAQTGKGEVAHIFLL
jgi:hypothetical protein